MPTSSLLAVAAGVLSALCYASVISGALLAVAIAYVAPMPLLLIGLGDGPRGVTIAALVASVLLAIFGDVMTGFVYFATEAVPTVLLVRVALAARAPGGASAWPQAGTLIAVLTANAIFLVLLAALATAIMGRGLEVEARTAISAMMAAFTPSGAPTPPPLSGDSVGLLIAAIAVSWMAMMVVNAVLAQTVLVRTGRNRRPSPAFAQATLPEWLSVVFVVAAIAGWVGPGILGFLGHAVATIAAMAFALVGLAVVHGVSRRVANRRMVLIGFYLTLLLVPILGLILVLIGFIEPWLQLRRRFGARGTGGGNAGHPT
ncbi:MAG: DUF2232 domain-containing protein [Alphaproteobacteria bacterium]|nr:DUF2232 domain-containing protein [Alphaproteobacteria bacterium]